MSEATNDLGHMHDNLHALVSHQDFRCKQHPDPPGAAYRIIKNFLQQYLKPGSFRTYWKLICAFELFMFKAFTPQTVISALKLGGFDGGKIDTSIMMGHNLEFCKLPEADAARVLRLVDTVFADYWWKHGLIHENIFDEVFDGEDNIDQLCDRSGKPLNQLATNRQRFMMDNHEFWLAELDRRDAAEEALEAAKQQKRLDRAAAEANKPKKCRECSDPTCPNLMDITTSKLRKDNEALWTHCTGKRCGIWGCPDHALMVASHINVCTKIVEDDV
jgi:hypothetical protein